MPNYNITLTDAQAMAMSHVTKSVEEYIQNFADMRANAVVNDIAQIAINHCLSASLQLPTSKEDMVQLAFDNELVKTAEQYEQEAIERIAAEAAQQG